jgi:AcrR family transcriptional regulator
MWVALEKAMRGHEQGNTRARIQSVALELFVEQGYDKTSLREIAERLGVTKAALYYHFRTKDDIVASAVEDLLAEVDAIVAWGRSQPPGAATRLDILRRYS